MYIFFIISKLAILLDDKLIYKAQTKFTFLNKVVIQKNYYYPFIQANILSANVKDHNCNFLFMNLYFVN